ncbi:TRAP transporter substrate-binding protein DctP [Paraburkholderia dipogonis]|uniref:TRAP transporter substrate-binding protein DctP n=1 Tax=Paraburkholderia dipogonis TaxID=1211383 RepID=A0ABW9B433_9BURK
MKTVRALGLVLLALGQWAIVPPAKAAEFNWRCYTYLPSSTDPAYQSLVTLAHDIGTATNGAVSITCNVGGSLPIKSSTIPSAIRDDVLQFGLTDSGSYTGFVPIAGLLSLPGLYQNDAALDAGIKLLAPKLDQEFAAKNVKLLGISYYPPQVLWSTQKLTSLADLKGQKIRVTTAEQAEFAKRAGAIPVSIDTPEVSAALQRGIVSAVLTSSSGGGRIWHDLLKYNLRTGANYVAVIFTANLTDFNKLTPAMQQKVSALGASAAANLTQLLRTNEASLTDGFAKGGMIVTSGTEGDSKSITAMMRPYWSVWAKSRGPEAEAQLARLRTALGQ